MRVVGLLENTTLDESFQNKHGLCLYIETLNHNILFDVGPDKTFLENAKALNINIEAVDVVIISHGHNDHGGGLEAFFEVNKKARVYIQESAFEPYFLNILGFKKNIGLDAHLKYHPQMKRLNGSMRIDDEVFLFTDPKLNRYVPEGNKKLLSKAKKGYIQDSFMHEQNLILSTEDKHILIAGCAHRGIVNIVEEAEKQIQNALDYVIGGFHLSNPISLIGVSSEQIEAIGEALKKKGYQYYTCHCTGESGYEMLRQVMREQIGYIHTGTELILSKNYYGQIKISKAQMAVKHNLD